MRLGDEDGAGALVDASSGKVGNKDELCADGVGNEGDEGEGVNEATLSGIGRTKGVEDA